ncbi:MAG: hypothetical protein HFACDABA_00526 [Anaerolineales bacterium]|nr:hypothetical protein [Anaerolineales bacterium]
MPSSKKIVFIESLLLLLIAALTYLPDMARFTFNRDDWFYLYDGLVFGPQAFVGLFENLRPMRGPFFAALFSLFGIHPLPYHILLFIWRVLGGFGMLWLIRLLWSRQPRAAFWGATLFVLYPGFLWWVSGFEYQPMVLSVTAQVFSFAFTLKAVTSKTLPARTAWTGAAIASSILALGMVEYAIGIEVLRYLCVVAVTQRDEIRITMRGLWKSFVLTSPSYLGAFGFLAWRQFFFENVRKAADVGLQLTRLADAPLTILSWLLRFLQSAADILLMAWSVPLRERFFNGELKDMLIALAWIGAASLLFFLFIQRTEESSGESNRWQVEGVLIGALGVAGSLIPILVANRYVDFNRFSHYALPGSIAAILFVVGFAGLVSNRTARNIFLTLLVFSAGLVHRALSVNAAREAETINAFWWQVAWRAPDIQPGTTLVVAYPGVRYQESSDLVWGPANFIYYPEAQTKLPVQVPLTAARMEGDLMTNVRTRAQSAQNYIIINTMRFDFGQLLALSQPRGSCVHAQDSRWTLLTPADDGNMAEIAAHSNVTNVMPGDGMQKPQTIVFGEEPPHTWCYYYQRADLARQSGDWDEVSALEAEAKRLGFAPDDPLEWTPFLQAHAVRGNSAGVEAMIQNLKSMQAYKDNRPYYKIQFCRSLRALDAAGYPLTPQMTALTEPLFCK